MATRATAFTPVIAMDRRSKQPLHAQIYRALRDAITRGSLRAGQRVPSSRAMSAELNVSRITILNAFAQLLAEGYFETRKGAGTFISRALPEQLLQCRQPIAGRPQKASGPRAIARRALLCPVDPRPPGLPVWVRSLSINRHSMSFPSPSGRGWSPITRRGQAPAPSTASTRWAPGAFAKPSAIICAPHGRSR